MYHLCRFSHGHERATVATLYIMHNHYNYSFKFNDILLKHWSVKCDLKQQKERFAAQLTMQFPELVERGNFLAYYNRKCCIEADTVQSKRASAAGAQRNFHCDDISLHEMITDCQSLPEHTNKYVSEDYLLELFHPYIVSANAVETILSDNTFRGYHRIQLFEFGI